LLNCLAKLVFIVPSILQLPASAWSHCAMIRVCDQFLKISGDGKLQKAL
jgi:hypothetical protein